MGLAITRGLLAAEGGRVWGENVEGGARFSIVVPAASQPRPVGRTDRWPPAILVVDDEPNILAAMRRC